MHLMREKRIVSYKFLKLRTPGTSAEREYAEVLHVRAVDVIVEASQPLHFLESAAAEQRVVDDEVVPARLARKRRDGFLDDGHDGKAAQLASITFPQDLADMELGKELLNLGRSRQE